MGPYQESRSKKKLRKLIKEEIEIRIILIFEAPQKHTPNIAGDEETNEKSSLNFCMYFITFAY